MFVAISEISMKRNTFLSLTRIRVDKLYLLYILTFSMLAYFMLVASEVCTVFSQ